MGREDGPRERTGNQTSGLVSSSRPCGLRARGWIEGAGAQGRSRGRDGPSCSEAPGRHLEDEPGSAAWSAARLHLALRPSRLRCVHVSDGVRVRPVVVGGETSPGCEGAGTDAQTPSSRERRARRDDLKGPQSPREQSEVGPLRLLPAEVSLQQPVGEARAAGQLGPSACGGPEPSLQC